MLPYVFAAFLLCLLIERLRPGWQLPQVKTWPMRVLLINLVQLAVVLLAGLTWEKWLSAWSVFSLSARLGTFGGGLAAYFVATFVFYWWHRWRHESNFLWLGFHQIHHSPRRLEVITSFYKHPGEMVMNSIIGSLLVYTLLGLSLEAGAIYTACTALGEFFYHTNIRTPRWIGYFFQRPEMHRIHHQYGRHRNNYGDITWWDMLFGTYDNPPLFTAKCGFDDAQEQRLKDMLLYRDVHKAIAATPRNFKEAESMHQSNSRLPLKSGDLVFVATPASLYRRVARATGSKASHVGIVFEDAKAGWVVAESAVPVCRYRPLGKFLSRSDDGWFVVRRLKLGLSNTEVAALRAACDARMGLWYHLGFKYESPRMFCSKFVYEAYQEALGIDVGELETFSELLRRNPDESTAFWKLWFFGRIPWQRKTITPASQMQSERLETVWASS